MQEQLGRLMVEAAAGAWDTPTTSPRQLDRDTVALLAQVPLFASLSRRHLGRIGSINREALCGEQSVGVRRDAGRCVLRHPLWQRPR